MKTYSVHAIRKHVVIFITQYHAVWDKNEVIIQEGKIEDALWDQAVHQLKRFQKYPFHNRKMLASNRRKQKKELNNSSQDFSSCPVKVHTRNNINMKQEHHTPFPGWGKGTCMTKQIPEIADSVTSKSVIVM